MLGRSKDALIRPFLSLLLLALLAVTAAPLAPGAQAQEAPAATAGESAEAPADATAATADTAAGDARALVEILRNDQTREALISELERVAGGGAQAPPADAASETAAADAAAGSATAESIADTLEEEDFSLTRELAAASQQIAENVAERVAQAYDSVRNSLTMMQGISDRDITILTDALETLALTIIVTVGIFLVLRTLAKYAFRRLGEKAEQGHILSKLFYIALTTLIDALVVLSAWALGYLIAVLAGRYGAIEVRQTLYLNAFLAVEMVKVAMRVALSPSSGGLRLFKMSDDVARYLARWSNVIISLIGYTQLLILPLMQRNFSFGGARALTGVILLITFLLMIYLVLANRKRFGRWLSGSGSDKPHGAVRRFIAYNWHVPAVIGLLAVYFAIMVRPDQMMLPVLATTGRILVAVFIGLALADMLQTITGRGISLPERINDRLPLLEKRINGFVPKLLVVVRAVIIVIVIAYVLNTLSVLNLSEWLTSQFGSDILAALIRSLIIISIAFLLWLAMASWVDFRLNPDYPPYATAREQTLLTLLRNAATIAITVITLMFVLSDLGIDIAPLIASAGVLGLAIGFGAQKLVQDIITGVFIQFESAIDVGDVVTVGGTTGTVERLTIRSVSLRDLNGVFHIIPFSSVDMVSNYMRGFSACVCEMGVAYRENIDEVKAAMLDAFAELRQHPDHGPSILGDIEWHGVTGFGDNAVTCRVRILTRPGKQWGLGRTYNEIIKRIFDERDIEIPFPHQTLYFGVDKQGKAPPMHVQVDDMPLGVVETRPEMPDAPRRARQHTAPAPDVPESDEGL